MLADCSRRKVQKQTMDNFITKDNPFEIDRTNYPNGKKCKIYELEESSD